MINFNRFELILINLNEFRLILGSKPDFRGSRESNPRPGRPGEGQGGPNKSQLEPKIGQNLQSKKYIYLEPMDIEPLIAIWSVMEFVTRATSREIDTWAQLVTRGRENLWWLREGSLQ